MKEAVEDGSGGGHVAEICRERAVPSKPSTMGRSSAAVSRMGGRPSITLDFIWTCKSVESGFIESFNGRLRDELLNAEIFVDIEEA